MTSGVSRLFEIENPRRSNSTNVGCAACHLSAETQDHVHSRFDLEDLDLESRYRAPGLDLSWPRPDDNRGKNMHAFSYFKDHATISPRVVNDSAEVVRFLRD